MKPPLTTARAIALSCCILFFTSSVFAQTIGSFSSVAPGAQLQTFVLPSTHTFQRLIKTGDALTLGGTLGDNLDFTGYVPIGGSSSNGRLSISSESTPAQVAILDVSFNIGSATWSVGTSGKVTFNPTDIGTVSRFCSGTVTPNNTIIVGEESTSSGNVNSAVDTYQDLGWLIEIDPATRTVINQPGGNPTADKLWAAGRQSHENAVIKSDNTVMYWGADANPTGYVYKFVPTVPGNFSAGLLYVLQTTAGLGNGTWQVVANSTVAERNNTVAASTTAGAYNFNGVEDVEIASDGRIYFTAKGQGKVYRFTDNGTAGTASDVTGLEVFVGNSSYPTITSYDVDGAGPLGTQPWNTGNDNLAFDGDGNLWVLNDGGGGDIWVVDPTHTQASPQVRLFAKTPAGSESTGITFTPNYRYMFISFQHPAATGSQVDATGTSITFNTHSTIVIARNEYLGPGSTLPVTFSAFNAKQIEADIAINWSVAEVSNHRYFAIERSTDGTRFEEIHRNTDFLDNGSLHSFNYIDKNISAAATTLYYRIKQCDLDDKCRYSEMRRVTISRKKESMLIYPVPAFDKINVSYYSNKTTNVTISIIDGMGRIVLKQKRAITTGAVIIPIGIQKLMKGNFTLLLDNGIDSYKQKFSKL